MYDATGIKDRAFINLLYSKDHLPAFVREIPVDSVVVVAFTVKPYTKLEEPHASFNVRWVMVVAIPKVAPPRIGSKGKQAIRPDIIQDSSNMEGSSTKKPKDRRVS